MDAHEQIFNVPCMNSNEFRALLFLCCMYLTVNAWCVKMSKRQR